MLEKKDQLIGARFSKKEKEVIESFVKKRMMTVTDFVREAIFSHMYNLEDKGVGHIEYNNIKSQIDLIKEDINKIFKSADNISENIETIDKELTYYDRKRIKKIMEIETKEDQENQDKTQKIIY